MWLNKKVLIILASGLALAVAILFFCNAPSRFKPMELPVTERVVQSIPLSGPAADRSSELSGLAWQGNRLYLLPQYPQRFGEGDGSLFYLDGDELRTFVKNGQGQTLVPDAIPFRAPGLKEGIPNFQGYEAIGFHDKRVYLSIEAGEGTEMHGYLVSGQVRGDGISLDPGTLTELKFPVSTENHAGEAIVVTDDRVLIFYEVNGAGVNPQPTAQVFDLDLNPLPAISFPALEYRVTDAAWNGDQLWLINYYFPGGEVSKPSSDPLAETFGQGHTHHQLEHVERIVGLEFDGNVITLDGRGPVQLELEQDARNWEGLALLDDIGFLLVTDKYPETRLGFVKFNP